MAFGQELKDFVSGFQAGYKMIDSPEDKQWKKDQRQMEKDRFQREDDWHKEGRADQEYNRNYRQGRDAVEDNRYNKQSERQDRNDAWSRYQSGRDFERQSGRDAESDRRAREQERQIDNQQKLGIAKDQGATNQMGTFLQNNPTDDSTTLPAPANPGNAGAIPDGNNTNAPAPDNTAPSDQSSDASAINPQAKSQAPNIYRDPTVTTAYRDSAPENATAIPAGYRQSGIDDENPTSGPQIAVKLVQDLQRDFSIPQHIAVGIVGQLAGESGGFTEMQEKKPTIPGSRGGYGYAQWTGVRRRAFEKFANDGGADPSSYQANYQYLRNELANTSESGVLNKLANAKDAQQAGRIFTDEFLRPGVDNYSGRARWTDMVNRAVQDLGNGQSGMPVRRATSAAVGGMISAIPDPEEEQQASLGPNNSQMPAAPAVQQAPVPQQRPQQEGAIPDGASVPTPQPRPDAPQGEMADSGSKLDLSDYEAGRQAVRDGLHQALKNTGADKSEAIDDPTLEKARLNYLRGYGAAPPQMMRQVLDTIDPDRKLPPAERNMKAMGTVYRFYMDQGDTEKAKEAAGSMVQYYRQASQQFLGLAQAAAQDGRLDDAAKAAVAAYTNIPNGRDLTINKDANGNYAINVTDIDSGKTITKQVVTPEQMGAAAMRFNPGNFDEEIMQAAAIKPEEFKPQSPANTQKTVDAVNMSYDGNEDTAKSNLNPQMQSLVKNTASNIAGIQANSKGADEAVQFASRMLSLDEDAKNKKPPYTTEKILGNRDFVRVHMDGDTVVMSKGKLNQIEDARKKLMGDRGKKQEADDASSKRWDDIKEQGKDMLDKVGKSAMSKSDIQTFDNMVKGFQDMQQQNREGVLDKVRKSADWLTGGGGGGAIPDEKENTAPPISGW